MEPGKMSCTPCQESNPASVATNEGTRAHTTITPWSNPMAAPAVSATIIPGKPDHPRWATSTPRIAAATPATAPKDRSISPSQ